MMVAFANLGFSKITKISFGMAVLLLQLFIFINSSVLFPNDSAYWNRIILTYLVMTCAVFAIPNLRSNFFNTNLFVALPKYLIAFGITYGLFRLVGHFFVNATYASYITGMTGISLTIIIIHSLIVGICEESIFRDFVMGKLGIFWSSLIFALFHFAVYGSNIGYMALMFILGLAFAYIKLIFSPQDGVVNSAVHGAYNISVYGI
jgi:hypothetical protein